MKHIEQISIPPATNLIDVVASEYSFNTAVADLIDNCIDGKATKVQLFFATDNNELSLIIVDNGCGIDHEHLKQAAIIGFKSSEELRNASALGRYSTGLKSASNFLANKVFVTSKTKKEINTLKVDFQELKKTGEWVAYFMDEHIYEKLLDKTGTAVICSGLKNISSEENLLEKIDSLRNYLEHIFGKFINENELEITIAKSLMAKPVLLKGWNPFFLPGNKSTKCVISKPIEFKGNHINFKIYILPSYSNLSPEDQKYMSGGGNNNNLNKLQGFYVYRSGRLISEAGWLLPEFDITEKAKYARIDVEIPSTLDKYFNVNLTKTKIEVPKELENHFRKFAQRARSESNKNFDYKIHPEIKPKINKKEEKIWISVNSTKGLVLRLNKDSSVLKNLCNKLSDNEFNQLLSVISKSFPLGFAMSQTISVEEYIESDIVSMVEKLYESMKKDEMSDKEINRKISQMEPFSSHLPIVVCTLEKLEKGENNDN